MPVLGKISWSRSNEDKRVKCLSDKHFPSETIDLYSNRSSISQTARTYARAANVEDEKEKGQSRALGERKKKNNRY